MGMFQVKKFDKHGVLDIKFQQLNSREDSLLWKSCMWFLCWVISGQTVGYDTSDLRLYPLFKQGVWPWCHGITLQIILLLRTQECSMTIEAHSCTGIHFTYGWVFLTSFRHAAAYSPHNYLPLSLALMDDDYSAYNMCCVSH